MESGVRHWPKRSCSVSEAWWKHAWDAMQNMSHRPRIRLVRLVDELEIVSASHRPAGPHGPKSSDRHISANVGFVTLARSLKVNHFRRSRQQGLASPWPLARSGGSFASMSIYIHLLYFLSSSGYPYIAFEKWTRPVKRFQCLCAMPCAAVICGRFFGTLLLANHQATKPSMTPPVSEETGFSSICQFSRSVRSNLPDILVVPNKGLCRFGYSPILGY